MTGRLALIGMAVLALAACAAARKELRGAYGQEDHPARDEANRRVQWLARVDQATLRLATRRGRPDPLTRPEDGGINLKKIAPKSLCLDVHGRGHDALRVQLRQTPA